MSESVVTLRREPKFIREPFDEIHPHGFEYIVKDLLPAHGIGFIAGPSESLKTFLALDWSFAINQGQPVLGHRSAACGIVYVAAESPNGVRKRIEAWKRKTGVKGLPFELIPLAPDLRDREQVEDLAAELRIAKEEMAARGDRLGLVVIDTLAASMPGGDENAGADMSAVLATVSWLAAELGAFLLIISHTGKDEARGIRGWSGQFAGADLVVMLTKEEGNPVRLGTVAKLKDGESGQRFALRLERVVLGVDDDDDEVSSAVVVYEDPATAPARAAKQRRPKPGEVVLLAALAHVTDHGETYPIPAAVEGARPDRRAVTRADVKARAMASGFADKDDKQDAIRQRFGRALQEIVAAGKVRVEGDLIWLL